MKIITKYQTQLVKESSKKYELEGKTIRSPHDAVKFFNEVFKMTEQPREVFVMFALNTKNDIIGAFEVFQGTVNASIVHPREIFQRLLLINATNFVVAHNHPSGDPTPSNEDREVTRRLHEAGKLIGIELLDHVIIGDIDDNPYRWVSLKEKNVI